MGRVLHDTKLFGCVVAWCWIESRLDCHPMTDIASRATHTLASPQTLISLDEDTRESIASLRTVLANGQASSHAIITTGHIGFWEILPAALARPALPVRRSGLCIAPFIMLHWMIWWPRFATHLAGA
ncbi:hypothetical protein GQ600_21867 [Phytophthora cactorum]|nr:hypothetical protein GQ600_21867 [Phytophthora cactorum]